MRTFGFSARARAISTICCLAMLISPAGIDGSISSPSRASASRATWIALRPSRMPRDAGQWPSVMFSAMLRPGMIVSSW